MTTVRVALPAHLRTLAGVSGELVVDVDGVPSVAGVLAAVEEAHPQLRGTIRDQATGERRSFLRYFASGEDISRFSPDAALPAEVVAGDEPLRIVGAIAGG